MSPSHHVSQIDLNSAQLAKPAKARLVTPHVALTVVLTTATTVNLKRFSV